MTRARLSFEVLTQPNGSASSTSARLGLFQRHDRTSIASPHYVAISSRGAVPHLSQDVMAKHTDLKGVYLALEDCRLNNCIVLRMRCY